MAIRDNLGNGKSGINTLKEAIKHTTEKTLKNSHAGMIKINSIRGKSVQDGTPTPENPAEIKSVVINEIWTHGKNFADTRALSSRTSCGVTFTPIYDINGDLKYVEANGTNDGTGASVFPIKVDLKVGEEYILSGCPIGGSTATFHQQIAWFGNDLGNGWTAKATAETKMILNCIVAKGCGTVSGVRFNPMVRKSNIPDETYEPYKEKRIKLSAPITLNGIVDAIDDFTPDGVVRKIGRIVLDGSDDEYISYNADECRVVTAAISELAKKPTSNDEMSIMMCNSFIVKPYSIASNDKSGIALSTSGTLSIFGEDFASIDEWKSQLSQNPLVLLYELAEPITEPLPTEDQIALLSLLSYDGVTYLECDSAMLPAMEVKYGASEVGALSIRNSNMIDVLVIGDGTFNFQEIAILVGGDA